jgi:hypothetical protein
VGGEFSLAKMLDKFRESQRFSLHSAIINMDVYPQSRDRLQCG